jgi:L-lysine 2,3-aminomutase
LEQWIKECQDAFRSLNGLAGFLGLDIAKAPFALAHNAPLCVPRSYAGRMEKKNWNDPLLLQVLPRAEELDSREGFTDDPVGDAASKAVPGLLHKYASRVLLLTTGECAVYCRFCFRKAFDFGSRPEIDGRIWEYIAHHGEVNEVILSGGEPLMLSDEKWTVLFKNLAALHHVKTIRIHTRVPVVLPSRITGRFVSVLSEMARSHSLVIAIHTNHPNELTNDCSAAIKKLRETDGILLGQTVLLRGINDSDEILDRLCSSLVHHGVVPYYLHQLDRMRGTGHFEVPEKEGKKILQQLRSRLPGYAVPRYVREITGASFKLPLG